MPHSYPRNADLWSKVGLIAGGCAALTLAVVDITLTLVQRPQFLAYPVHSIMVGLIVAVVVSSVVTRIGLRLLRMQLLMLVRIDARRPDPDPGREVAPFDVDGLSPEMIEIARRTSARLDNAA